MSGLPQIRLSTRNTTAPGLRPAAMLTKWVETRATRAALARLDAHLLQDIGLEKGTAQREAARPFWRE